MAKVSSNKLHQGELLRELYNYSSIATIEEFSKKFNRSRVWTGKAFKWEIIPVKDRYNICRAFNIPAEYFDGKFKLTVQESDFASPVDIEKLQQELEEERLSKMKMMEKLLERDQKIIELQEELMRIMTLIKK